MPPSPTAGVRHGKLPFVQQMEAVDCGAASLTMILRYFGRHVELSEVRDAAGVSRDGVTAKGIVQTARRYGLVPKARRLEPEDLANVTDPAILHWEMNHFVVLDRWAADEVRILDPAMGPRAVSKKDFDTSFTGVCIELSAGEKFEKRTRRRASLDRYLAVLRGASFAMALLVLSSVLLNVFGLGVPVATQLIVDQVLSFHQASWLPVVAVAVLSMVAAQLLVNVTRAALLARVREHLDAQISEGFVLHMLALPMRVLSQRPTADLVERVAGAAAVREMLMGNAITLLVDGVLLLSYLALAMAYEWRLGLVIATGLGLYIAAYLIARPRQVELFRERKIKDIKRDVELYQALLGILTLKSAGREEGAYERWQQKAAHADGAVVREAENQSNAWLILTTIRAAVPAAVLLLGASLVLDSKLTLGSLLGVQFLQALIFVPLQRLIQTLLRAQELPVQLERMDDILLTEVEPSGERPCPKLDGEVRFEDVCFRYGPTAPLTVDHVSFTVNRGEKIALVGASGSGKSTLGRLLTGLFRVESGKILLDGHDLSELDLATVRKQIGVVMQETAIFEGTVAENLALYRRGASLSEVVDAARVAQVHNDIEALPRGYDTPISSSSCPLSGGQRQRLALARALLHRPAIMLLDEATSALDTVTEAAVEQFLASRLCTRIVIAHRLSTVRDADRILVLDKGKVVEQGRHAELIALGGLYAELAQKQASPADNTHADTETLQPVALAGSATSSEATLSESAPADRRPSVDDLSGFPLFSSDDAARVAASGLFERRAFAKGTTVVAVGDRGRGLFLVECGALAIMLHEPGLRPFQVGRIDPGGIFGELSLIGGTAAAAEVVTLEDTSALLLAQGSFDTLRGAQDPLAARLILGLGRVIATRLRAINAQRTSSKVTPSSRARANGRESVDAAGDAKRAAGAYEMRIEETQLGASLTKVERARLFDIGTRIHLAAGEAIYRRGDTADRLFLVLRGRLGLFSDTGGPHQITKAGEIVGEDSFFDLQERAERCDALEPSTVFAIDHARLRGLLLDGGDAAWKLLRHLIHSLAGDLRMATLMLREEAAHDGGELEAAHRAREEAERLADAEDEALARVSEDDEGRVPVVLEQDPVLGGAICLTALLRHYRRPVRVVAVIEACRAEGELSVRSLEDGAKTFGMLVRRIGATADELRWIDRPLLIAIRGGGYMVADGFRGGRLEGMDPRKGRVALTPAEVTATLTEDCLEIWPDEHGATTVSLAERVMSVVRRRRSAVSQMVATTVLEQIAALAVPITTSYVIGHALPAGDRELLRVAALALTAVMVGSAITERARNHAVLFLRTHLDRGLVQQLFRHVLRLPVMFFEGHPPGEIVQHFDALRVLRSLLGTQGIAALLDLPAMLISAGYLLWLDAELFALVACASLGYMIVFAAVFPRLRSMAAAQYASSAQQRDRLIEVIAGVATLRLTGDTDAGMRLWSPLFRRDLRLGAAQDRVASTQYAALEFIQRSALALTLVLGTTRVMSGDLSLGTLMAFSAMAAGFLGSLEGVLGYLSSFLRAREVLTRLAETFAETVEQSGETVTPPGKLRGRVTLQNVSFGYQKDGPKILTDISLDIEPGSKVALVGGSGAGKSTLGRLLLGFYAPRSGRILYDGRDLRGIDLPRLRHQLGVVMQDSYLFSGSIRENLALGAPDAPIDKLIVAAKKAAIHDVIEAMPMKYETMVTEGGTSFSGGQRQRISLARALVHEPAILLLDEATSALDNLAQRAVETQLAELPCTRIVIAHRLSTVIDADQILVLIKGQIVERGTHPELMAQRGHYHRMAEGQL